MSSIYETAVDPSTIPTPAAGQVVRFVDATTGLPSYKDSTGAVHTFTGPKGDQGDAGEAGPGVPSGGTTGQLAAKASDSDYDVEWIDAPAGGGSVTGITYDETNKSFRFDVDPDRPNTQTAIPALPSNSGSTPSHGLVAFGDANTQAGMGGFQAGYNNSTSAGYYCVQFGSDNKQTPNSQGDAPTGFQWGSNTQSGYYVTQFGLANTQADAQYSTQSGYSNTQSGNYNTQSGTYNTQSGGYGFQHGGHLDDGGFDGCVMFGSSKTATAAERMYLALANGLWFQPNAEDAASPEEGVLAYNSTLHKLRIYTGSAWETVQSS